MKAARGSFAAPASTNIPNAANVAANANAFVMNASVGPGPGRQKAESQWYIYWMQTLPGAGNTIPHNATTMENWWELLYHWDESLLGGKKLYQ
jgi:hypothetical protein